MLPLRPRLRIHFQEGCLHLVTSIEAKTDTVVPLVERAFEIIRGSGGVPGREYDVAVALREALYHSISQHRPGVDAGKIRIRLDCTPSGGIRMVISNPRNGPLSAPDHAPARDSRRARTRYALLRSLMDHVRFSRGGRKIKMSLWRSRTPLQSSPRRARTVWSFD